VQEQMTVTRNLSVGAGVRYEWQNLFRDNNNIAPRGSFAWAIRPRTVVRGGAGIFYERGGDGVIRDILRSRDDRLARILLLEPSYPDPFASVSIDGTRPASLIRVAGDVHM